jgi:phosphoserine phosphatase RsbU/P
VLGRHPECDIVVDSLDASRYHAQIIRIGEEFFLEDLHSTNGTLLNDEAVRIRQKLKEGDRIRISDVTFEFHGGVSPQMPTRAEEPGPQVSVNVAAEDKKFVVLSRREASHEMIADRTLTSLQAELKAMLRITQSLRKSLVLDEVLGPILDTLFDIFPRADRGFIVLKTDDGSLVPRWTKLRASNASKKIRISRAIVAKVMESQQSVLSADVSADRRFDPTESLRGTPNRAMMCAPLIDGEGRSFGALQLDGADAQRPFSDSDLEIFTAVAIQTSIAIDNARLHERVAKQQSVENQRDFADRLQQSILPNRAPELAGYSFFQYYRPAATTGGDFYDYVSMYDGRLMAFMADITGHGIEATVLIARLALEIRASLLISSHPADMVRNLNRALFAHLPQDHFVKLVAMELIPVSGDLTVVNAGHHNPLVCSMEGLIHPVGSPQAGLPLGIEYDAEYAETRLVLPTGSTLILHTGGIAQATDAASQPYGLERLRTQVSAARGGATAIGERIVNDLRQFIGAAPQRDDICLVCMCREGTS